MKTQQHVRIIISQCVNLNLHKNKRSPQNHITNKKHDSLQKTHTVVLIWDCHRKGCAENITDLLDKSYSVIGITKPNANLEIITLSKNLKTEKLTREDITIICRGTIDVGSEKSLIWLHYLINLAKKTESAYVIMVDVANQYNVRNCV